MVEAELQCVRAAAQQDGLITRAQATKWLTARQVQWRLEKKAWVRVRPAVYRVEGAPEGWRQRLRALSLWVVKSYAFSHRTAARLHGLEKFAEAEALEVMVTRHLTVDDSVSLHRTSALTKHEVATVDGLKVTSMARTLIDLASLRNVDYETLAACVNQALREKKATLDDLDAMLERVKGVRGCPRIRALVHKLRGGDGPLESELEEAVTEVLEMAQLPQPEKQRAVHVGGRLRRLDFRYKQQRVIIEADGYAWHSDVVSFEKDRQRHNSLTAVGYVVLQWTWTAIQERPEELVTELVTLLASRS